MKIIRINGIEYALYPAGENTDVSVYPHMVMVSSGEIPKGNQKRLLTDFLRANGVTQYKIETWRQTYNYEAFNDCIGKLLDDNGIHIPFRRRKFDHFLWYANR